MKYREFGSSQLKVSEIAMGTVSLGMDYGIRVPGGYSPPEDSQACALLRDSFEAGINLFDTAPGYGRSEKLIGKALAGERSCLIATKISFESSSDYDSKRKIREWIDRSVNQSLCNLKRQNLDLLQIHNAKVDTLENSFILEELNRLKDGGVTRFLGASIYSEEEALTAIRSGCMDFLQVPFNILDQRMKNAVTDTAKTAGVDLIARSVYLKGALTEKAIWLPPDMEELKKAVKRTRRRLDCSWDILPQYALRFVLSNRTFSSVLVGMRTSSELMTALNAVDQGRLSAELLSMLDDLSLNDPFLYNPVNWSVQ